MYHPRVQYSSSDPALRSTGRSQPRALSSLALVAGYLSCALRWPDLHRFHADVSSYLPVPAWPFCFPSLIRPSHVIRVCGTVRWTRRSRPSRMDCQSFLHGYVRLEAVLMSRELAKTVFLQCRARAIPRLQQRSRIPSKLTSSFLHLLIL